MNLIKGGPDIFWNLQCGFKEWTLNSEIPLDNSILIEDTLSAHVCISKAVSICKAKVEKSHYQLSLHVQL